MLCFFVKRVNGSPPSGGKFAQSLGNGLGDRSVTAGADGGEQES